MRKMPWSKFKLPFITTGRSEIKGADGLAENSIVIDEEYKEALRTKSYTEMFNKVQGQLRRKSLDRLTSSSSFPLHIHLSEYLLEPQQETLTNMIEVSDLHHLLINYFEASLEACNTCELLLHGVHQARANNRIIKRAIKLTRRTRNCSNYTKDPNFPAIFEELSSFAMLRNPLLIISPGQFRDIHNRHGFLLDRLVLKFRKIRRRVKINRFGKKILGFSLVVSCTALVSALLVLAVHSMVGVIAAPGLITCSLGLVKRKSKLVRRELKTSFLERLGLQLEVAAKGVFILINDFDTMSRLVGRLQDEIEHSKAVADMCVRNGKWEVLMEVVREFQIQQTGFLEQLEELEEHIYLCFLTINRSRMLVMREIMVLQQEK